VWTPWNVFFTSAIVLFTLFVVLFTCYLVSNRKAKAQNDVKNDRDSQEEEDDSDGVVNDDAILANQSHDQDRRVLLASFSNGDGEAISDEAILAKLSRDQKRTLLLARLASFANGASFACHISLLPIQVTSLVDLDGELLQLSHRC
jgi:hypothetical protein